VQPSLRHEAPSGPCRGGSGLDPWIDGSYFFFAAFALLDPQEDLPLFATFFIPHAMLVPPFAPVCRRGRYRRPRRPVALALAAFLAAAFATFFAAFFTAGFAACAGFATALNSPRMSSRNLS
jgi:hypothetical protein